MKVLNIPVGISNFEKIRNNGFYYVDKTGLIEELLKTEAEVTLITRPRRFGKTLGMSMLESFFDIRKNSRKLFEGLEIARQSELCSKWMNQCPTVSVSFRQVDGLNFTSAYDMLTMVFADLYNKHLYLLEDSHVTEFQKKTFTNIAHGCGSEKEVKSSLVLLTTMMQQHYGKAVVLLIDEYDVPVAKANAHGYYNEMLDVMKGLLQALKDNQALCFAVVTGCLKIAKESIFTGLNNLKVLTLTDVRFDEYFGFTDAEVRDMLAYYDLSGRYEEVKEWYDGYRFGNVEVYCPWDVINYCDLLKADSEAHPQDYWSNTSGNAMVRRFIDKADTRTRNEIEKLISGEEIVKEIRQELTYSELDSSIENLWSVLFTTGYLTQRGQVGTDTFKLAIPNLEIRRLFIKQIREWFRETSQSDGETLNEFCNAFPRQNPKKIEELFGDYLWNTISIRDTAPAKKENFYHGILLGLLGYKSNWLIKSNAESGIGYSDILVEVPDNRTGIVIELKYAENGNMDAACEEALKQIEDRDYTARLRDDGMRNIIKYGIACYKKNCKVVLG